ncbi:MAG: LacI family transcriptional regulator [Tissierella sp.]|nr:LacI family transcriptional regulator [Tissierella sp.]
MAVTIKDVAKLAEVSISTVSRVINESKPVSPEARRRVQHAIETLGYEPNEVARSLVTKKSNLIGVIVDDIGNHYVSQIVRGIEEIGRMYNYDIIVSSSYGNADTELKFLQLLKTKQVEGIILVSEIINQGVVDYMKKTKLEFMYLNRYYNVPELPTIALDNKKAVKMMMDYLIELGHKKILYLSQETNSDNTIEIEKIEAYKESMRSIGEDPILVQINNHRVDGGYKIGREIVQIKEEKGVTAVFCCQDELAIGLMNYLYDNGINVPNDISVSGHGDINVASIYRPTLTTTKEPYYDMGAISIRKMLKKLIGEPINDEEIVLPIRLIKRESCKNI